MFNILLSLSLSHSLLESITASNNNNNNKYCDVVEVHDDDGDDGDDGDDVDTFNIEWDIHDEVGICHLYTIRAYTLETQNS